MLKFLTNDKLLRHIFLVAPPFLCSISRLPLRTKTFVGPNFIETIVITCAWMPSCFTFINVCKTIIEITKLSNKQIPFSKLQTKHKAYRLTSLILFFYFLSIFHFSLFHNWSKNSWNIQFVRSCNYFIF